MKKTVMLLLLIIVLMPKSMALNLPDELESAMPLQHIDLSTSDNINNTLKRLGETFKGMFAGQIANAFKSNIKIFVLCGIASVSSGILQGSDNKNGIRFIEIASLCLIAAIAVSDAKGILYESKQAISEIDTFSKILLPIFATWASAAGKPVSAIMSTSGAIIYTDICCKIAIGIIFPLIFAYIFLKISGHIGENHIAIGLADAIKNCSFFLVKAALMGITLYLTISGALMSVTDGLAVKAASTAAGLLPVVGTALSGAAESVLLSASLMRNTIGAAGMIGVVAFGLSSFIRLSVNVMIFKVISLVAMSFTSQNISKGIDAIANGYLIALGALAMASGGIIMSITLSVSLYGG